MLDGPGPHRSERQLARLGARGRDKIGQRAVGRCTVDDDHAGRADEVADRLETRQRIKVQLSQMRRDHQVGRGDQQGVAVRRRARDRLGSDDRTGTRAVLDHHRPPLGLADLLGKHAGHDVAGAASGRRHDDLDGCLGPSRMAKQRHEKYGNSAEDNSVQSEKCVIPSA